MVRILDLGCGVNKRPGAFGVDANPAVAPDLVHDLNCVPYPLEDSTFDEVYLDNVLEHVSDVVRTMEEVHRVAKAGAMVRVDVPYFRSRYAAIDPTHIHPFTVESFAYFDPTHPFFERYRYSAAAFRVERVVFNERFGSRGMRAAIARYANRNVLRYEARISQFFPLDELTFHLRVVAT